MTRRRLTRTQLWARDAVVFLNYRRVPATARAVARETGLTTVGAAWTLRRLARRGLVERDPHRPGWRRTKATTR